MNVSVFETVIGMNLVAISAETINMTVSEQFLMPKCWIDFSTTGRRQGLEKLTVT